MGRVLVVGGYGVFGSRICERLARDAAIEVIVAGRSADRARDAAAALTRGAKGRIGSAVFDATRPDTARLREIGPAVVVNASGPFQAQDHALAEACVDAGAHYIDLADATAFVLGLSTHAGLAARARQRGVLLVTGASSVPGLSSAVIDHLKGRFARLDAIRHGISPGNSFDPGPATTASIMGGLGRPFATLSDGEARIVHGWQGLTRHHFPGLGRRWLGYCDVPDLVLFAKRYAGVRTIDFRAGVEVGLFHLGLWALSWPCRAGLIRRPERMASAMLSVKRRLRFLGTDRGGMFVVLEGSDAQGRPAAIAWHLIAGSDHGPYVPATPAVIVARKLLARRLAERGAMACLGLFTLEEFAAEVADLDIRLELPT